jgi:hypothetical protein
MPEAFLNTPIEHPIDSGIRISVVANRVKGKTYSRSFRVSIPGRITGRGRIRKQFPTLEKAKTFAGGQYHLSKMYGQEAFKMTQKQRLDAVEALEILKGTDLTLSEVAQYARLLEHFFCP